MTKDHLLTLLRPHGQEHLLAFWDELDPTERESLAGQIGAIDFALICRLHEGCVRQEDMARVGRPAPRRRRPSGWTRRRTPSRRNRLATAPPKRSAPENSA